MALPADELEQVEPPRYSSNGRYSLPFKLHVQEFAKKHGVEAACNRFDVPKGRVSKWLRDQTRSLTGTAPSADLPKTVAKPDVLRRIVGLPRHAQKELLANELHLVAADLLDRLRGKDTVYMQPRSGGEPIKIELDRPSAADVKNLLTAVAIAVDKSTLLAGEATSRSERVDVKDLESALNDVIADPKKRRELALRVLGGGQVQESEDKAVTKAHPHTKARVPGARAARRVAKEAEAVGATD